MTLKIRESMPSDLPAILRTIREAFGDEKGSEVADLVSALLIDPTASPVVSLVAELQSEVVGQILFSCARIGSTDSGDPEASILAPLCVHPEHQGRAIGSALVREGLRRSRRAGCGLVFVLGHPGYYPKHGFVPAGPHGFEAPYPIPEQHADAWMVQELRSKSVGATRGVVICAEALMDPTYWRE